MLSQIFASLSVRGFLRRDSFPSRNDLGKICFESDVAHRWLSPIVCNFHDISSQLIQTDSNTRFSEFSSDSGVEALVDNHDLHQSRANEDEEADPNGNATSSSPNSSSASTSSAFPADRRPQSLFPPPPPLSSSSSSSSAIVSPMIPPISKVTKQSFVQQASLRGSNGFKTPDSPYSPSVSSSSAAGAKSAFSTTPGSAKRLSADPSSDLLPSAAAPKRSSSAAANFDDAVFNAESARRPTSQQGQQKPRPRSAVEAGSSNASAAVSTTASGPLSDTFYSALSSSGDRGMFGREGESPSLLENCDMDDDDEDEDDNCGLRRGMNNNASGKTPDASSSGDFGKKVPRKKWRASAEGDDNPFKVEFFGKPPTTASSSSGLVVDDASSRDSPDGAGFVLGGGGNASNNAAIIGSGTWSKGSSPVVLSTSSQPLKATSRLNGDAKALSSRSFNVNEKVGRGR